MFRRIFPVVLSLAAAMPAMASLRGTAELSDGRPAAHATVQVFAPERFEERNARLAAMQDRKPLATMTTGDDGSFSSDEKLPSTVDLLITSQSTAPASRRARITDDIWIYASTATSVKGSVVCGGKPAANAFVVFSTQQNLADASREFIVRTSADGSFSVPDPSGWADSVTVVQPSCAPFQSDVQRGVKTRALRFEMENGNELRGRVTANGRPFAGATIYADGWPVTKSGEDGTFKAQHVAKRVSLVTATAGELSAASPLASSIELALEKSHAIHGVVREAKSHAGIEGVCIALYDEDAGVLLASAFSDASGKYEIRSLPGRKFSFLIAVRGYENAGGADRSTDLRRVASAEKNFDLAKLAIVSGRVVDGNGRPVGGALVSLWFHGGPAIYAKGFRSDAPFGATMFSRPDGSFALEMNTRMPNDEFRMTVMAIANGFAAGRSGPISAADVRDHDLKNVMVRLARGKELRGVVSDPSGVPLSGVSVAVSEDGTFAGYAATIEQIFGTDAIELPQTDAKGEFALQVNDVSHTIGFNKRGYALSSVKHVRPGDALKVVLDPGAVLRGRIVYDDGTPIPDVMAVLTRGEGRTGGTTTGDDGTFAIDDVKPGTYQLQLYRQDDSFSDVRTVTVPGDELLIRVQVGGTIRGHVTDTATHQPLGTYYVSLQPASRDDGDASSYLMNRQVSVTNSDGAFEITHVRAGNVIARIDAEGYRTKKVGPLTITDKGSQDVDVALDRGVTIEGRVTSSDGSAIEDVAVNATNDAEGDDSAETYGTTDAEGHYSISGITPGRWKFNFSHDDYVAKETVVDVTTAVRVDAALSRGVVLRGTVTSAGTLVEGAWVRADSDSDGHVAETDSRGNYELSGLKPQTYNIAAGKEGVGETQLSSIEVAKLPRLDLRLEKQPVGTISGHVTGVPGGDLMLRTVIARNEKGKMGRAAIDEAGNYRIESAPAGHVTVMATIATDTSGGRTSRPKIIDLSDGESAEVDLEFRSDITVSGTVTRENQPVFSAYVYFSGEGSEISMGAKTDEAGRYEIVGLEPGEYNVTASAAMSSGYTTTYVVSGSSQFDIDMTGAKLRGSVVDATTGDPVSEASVSLWRTSEGSGSHPVFDTSTDASGTFMRSAIAEGTYRILAQKDGYAQEMQEIELSRGSLSEVSLRMTPAGGIRVAVVDSRDGRTLDAISIVRDRDRKIVANQHSSPNSDGSVTISLADGSYLLSVSSGGYGSVTVPVTSPSPTVRVPLTPGGTLVIRSKRDLRGRVRLVDANGEEYVQCWCNGLADIRLSGQETRVEHITPNTYVVELIDEFGNARQVGSVTIGEGRDAVLEVE